MHHECGDTYSHRSSPPRYTRTFTMRAASAPMFLAILIHAAILWSPCDSYYKYQTERRMGGKLTQLTRELLLDVETKIKAVQSFRDQYYKSLQYQLGDIVYEMRNYFKYMVRLYQLTHQDVFYGHGNYHKSIPTLMDVQRMAMDIETKVTMVQGWQYKRETKEEHRERMLAPLRSGAPRGDDESEPLREVAARARMQQNAPRLRAGAPARSAAPAPAPPRRKNKKWRHVTNNDFSIL